MIGLLRRLRDQRKGTVSVTTAARFLDVSPRTLRRYCREGVIDGAYQNFGDGTNWRIPVDALVDAAGVSDLTDLADLADSGEEEDDETTVST